MDKTKLAELKTFIADCVHKPYPSSYLIAVLHRAQELFGYLDKNIMDEVAYAMNIPSSNIWGVATFYNMFTFTAKGKHSIAVCLGTACYVKGAETILRAIKEELKVEMGGTTEDGLFTLGDVRCLGACGLAPVVMIDDKVYGQLTPKKIVDILRTYKNT